MNSTILCSFQPLWSQTDCDAQKFREEKGNGLEIEVEPCWLNHEKILPEIQIREDVCCQGKITPRIATILSSGSDHLVGAMQEPENGRICSALGKCSAVWGVGQGEPM